MTETIADMKERLRAQEAYGKWNTAGLANRIHEAERAAMSPVRRRAQDLLDRAVEAAALTLGYAPFVLMAWGAYSSWIG